MRAETPSNKDIFWEKLTIDNKRAWDLTPGLPVPWPNLMKYRRKRQDSIFSSVSKPGTVIDDPEGDGTKKIINQYVILKTIGSGSYAEVKLCYNKENKTKYAMKIFNLSRMRWVMVSKEKTGEDNLLSEIAIMKKLKHPNIINLVEVIEEKQSDELYIIMEYVPNGTLSA